MRPFRSAFLFIASILEGFLSWIDHVFHTRLSAPKISLEAVEPLIQARLPIGATLDKALEFLDEQKYECDHALITDSAHWNQTISPHDYKIAAVQPAIRKMAIAWRHQNGGRLLLSWETHICLFFDDNDHLLTYLLEVFSTGP